MRNWGRCKMSVKVTIMLFSHETGRGKIPPFNFAVELNVETGFMNTERTLAHTHTHSRIYTFTLTHSLIYTLTQTHTCTHTLTQTHTHAHTNTLTHSRTLALKLWGWWLRVQDFRRVGMRQSTGLTECPQRPLRLPLPLCCSDQESGIAAGAASSLLTIAHTVTTTTGTTG